MSGKRSKTDDLEDYESNFGDEEEDPEKEQNKKRKDALTVKPFSQPGTSKSHTTGWLLKGGDPSY
jgi:hypothetical protein